MFIFAKCLRSSAAVTPAKYELDIIKVTTDLIIQTNWENNGTEKIGLVTPTPTDLLSIYRVNKRQWYMIEKIFFVLKKNIGKFLFLIFHSGLKVLMSIEWFASTRKYWYNTICGFSILYCCLRKILD